jgi:hypothetical protein
VAGADRVTIGEVVRKVLLEEQADVVEVVRIVVELRRRSAGLMVTR